MKKEGDGVSREELGVLYDSLYELLKTGERMKCLDECWLMMGGVLENLGRRLEY